MDEYKLKIKKHIKDCVDKCNRKTKFGNKEETNIDETINFIREIYDLVGYREEGWGNRKKYLLEHIYYNAKEFLESEYTRLNRIDNPYKYVPEEWLEMEANDIIRIINKKWQKELPDGRVEQEYWVEYEERKTDNGTRYTVYERYCGNSGRDYDIYGDENDSLKDCVLAFWERRSDIKNFVSNFWD